MARRVQIGGPQPKTKGKYSSRPSVTTDDEMVTGRKPGLETSLPHIAQMWIGRDNDLALSLTRSLNDRAAKRVGVVRRDRG